MPQPWSRQPALLLAFLPALATESRTGTPTCQEQNNARYAAKKHLHVEYRLYARTDRITTCPYHPYSTTVRTIVGSRLDANNQDEGVEGNSLPLERFPRRRKLSQLMADHFLRNGNREIVLSVVHHKLSSGFVDLSISFRTHCQPFER